MTRWIAGAWRRHPVSGTTAHARQPAAGFLGRGVVRRVTVDDRDQMSMRQEPHDALEQRQVMGAIRYDIIDALQQRQGTASDTELAAATGHDLATIREAATDLATANLIELISPAESTRSSGPEAPTDEPAWVCRLSAI